MPKCNYPVAIVKYEKLKKIIFAHKSEYPENFTKNRACNHLAT